MIHYRCYVRVANSDRWEPVGGRVSPKQFATWEDAAAARTEAVKKGFMGKPVVDTTLVSVKEEAIGDTELFVTKLLELVDDGPN